MIDPPVSSAAIRDGKPVRAAKTDARDEGDGSVRAFSHFIEKGTALQAEPNGKPKTPMPTATSFGIRTAVPFSEGREHASPTQPRTGLGAPVPVEQPLPDGITDWELPVLPAGLAQPAAAETPAPQSHGLAAWAAGIPLHDAQAVTLDSDIVERVLGSATEVELARPPTGSAVSVVERLAPEGAAQRTMKTAMNAAKEAVTEHEAGPVAGPVTGLGLAERAVYVSTPTTPRMPIAAPLSLSDARVAMATASVSPSPHLPDGLTQMPATIRISLRPAELGPVQVVIHTGSETTRVRITAETDAGYAALLNKSEVLAALVRDLRSASHLPPADDGQPTLSFGADGQGSGRNPMGETARDNGQRGDARRYQPVEWESGRAPEDAPIAREADRVRGYRTI